MYLQIFFNRFKKNNGDISPTSDNRRLFPWPRHFFQLILCYKKGIMQLIIQYLIDFYYCCPINYWPDRKNQDWHLFFKTDFYRLGHRFSQYCVYQCYVCGNFVFYCSEVVVMG